MSASIKRYTPYLVLVAAAGAGVYFTQSGRLAGEAGRIHNEEAGVLGTVDEQTLGQLDDLVKLNVIPGIQSADTPAAHGLMSAIENRGVDALASVATHFRDNGCVQPGATSEVRLLGRIATRFDIQAIQRQMLAEILLDAAKHAATGLPTTQADPNVYSTLPQIEQVASMLKRGEMADLPDVSGALPPSHVSVQRCVRLALATVGALVNNGVTDPAALFENVSAATLSLPAGHRIGEDFMGVLVATAHLSKQPTASLVHLVGNASLNVAARNAVCRAAANAKATAAQLRGTIGSQVPAGLIGCLVLANDEQAMQEAANSDDADLRLLAASHTLANPLQMKEANFERKTPGTTARPASIRVQAIRQIPSARFANARTELAGDGVATVGKNVGGAEADAPKPGATLEFGSIDDFLPTLSPEAEAAGLDKSMSLQCDLLLEPGEIQRPVDNAIKTHGPGVAICAKPGTYVGSLELTAPVRLISIEPQGAVIEGGVLFANAASISGFKVLGPVIIGTAAIGTSLSSNHLERGGFSSTPDVQLADNAVGTQAKFFVPGGSVNPANFLRPGNSATPELTDEAKAHTGAPPKFKLVMR